MEQNYEEEITITYNYSEYSRQELKNNIEKSLKKIECYEKKIEESNSDKKKVEYRKKIEYETFEIQLNKDEFDRRDYKKLSLVETSLKIIKNNINFFDSNKIKELPIELREKLGHEDSKYEEKEYPIKMIQRKELHCCCPSASLCGRGIHPARVVLKISCRNEVNLND